MLWQDWLEVDTRAFYKVPASILYCDQYQFNCKFMMYETMHRLCINWRHEIWFSISARISMGNCGKWDPIILIVELDSNYHGLHNLMLEFITILLDTACLPVQTFTISFDQITVTRPWLILEFTRQYVRDQQSVLLSDPLFPL